MKEADVIALVKETDPEFSGPRFKQWCNQLLQTLQDAWSNKDYNVLKSCEVKKLYELHKSQLETMASMDVKNVTEDMEIISTKLVDYQRIDNSEVFKVELKVSLIDYYRNVKTKHVLRGWTDEKVNAKYILEIVRDNGFLTEWLTDLSSMTCPNCGAPLNLLSEKKCPYCDSSFITMDNSYKVKTLELQR